MKKFLYFFMLWIVSLCSFKSIEGKPLTLNLVSIKNGCGLEVDPKILGEALENLGHEVRYKYWEEISEKDPWFADVNIFFEHLLKEFFPFSSYNWFIPNPEWCYKEDVLEPIDLILCRTREVERIFKDLNKETYFLGFTQGVFIRKI